MAEIRQEFKFDDRGMLDGMREMRDLAVSIEKSFDEAGEGAGKFSKDVQTDMNNSRKALDKVVDGLDKKAEATKEDDKATKQWLDTVKQSTRDLNVFGVNVGQTVDKLKNMQSSMLSGAKAIGGGTKALKAFRIALASTGIGLIVVALGSLITYFTKTQRGLDRLNIAFAAIRSVIDNVIDRVAMVGEGFASIFSGNVRKGLGQIKDSFAGMGEEIIKDINAAKELERRQQELIKVQRALTVEESKRRTEIEKLREESRKQGVTEEEAIAKLEKAGRIEDQLAAKRQAAAREEYEIIKQRNELADSKNADLDAEAAALARLESIEGERARKSRRYLSELESFRNKSAADQAAQAKAREEEFKAEEERIKDLKEAYQDFISIIENRVEQENLAMLSGIERIEEERRIANEQIKLLEAQAKAAALAAGEVYNLDQHFKTLYQNIEKGYKQAVDDLTAGRENDKVIEALLPTRGVASNAERLIKNYKTALNLAMTEESGSALESIREGIMDWLGVDEQGMQELVGTVGMAFDQLGGMYSESINRQLDENGRLLDNLAERESIIQKGLERELRLQEEGRANNVEGKRAELEAIRKEEEKAEKEAAKLRRRQQAAELAANLVKQGSNLATAVSEIFAANAGIPIVGIIQAGVSIAAMFAAFANAKTQAQGLVGRRAFKGGPMGDYLGGKRSSGFVKRGGMSDIPGRGDGYRVMGTDLAIGGDEFMMNERESVENERFLTAMNAGKFRGIDLNAFASSANLEAMTKFNRMTSIRRAKIDRASRERKDQLVVETLNRNFAGLMKLQRGQIDRMAISDYEAGWVEFDSNGNKKIIRK